MVGVLYRDDASPIISVVDVISGVHTHDIRLDNNRRYEVWAHEESLRFANIGVPTTTIWEVGFTPGATLVKVETLSLVDFNPTPWDRLGQIQFFPVPGRFTFTYELRHGGKLLVWNAQNPEPLLHEASDYWYPTMTFSSDGRFFACSTSRQEVRLWKESPTGYIRIGKLPSGAPCSIPLLSPDGESIITFGGPTIQLWRTKGFTTPLNTWGQVTHNNNDFVLEFVPDRQLAAVTRRGEETVTVLDLKSGLPQLIIDASVLYVGVYGLRVVENTVAVTDDRTIITWNLPEGNFLPHARVGVNEITQKTHFSGGQQGFTIAASISLDFRNIAILNKGYTSSHPDLHLHVQSTGYHNYPISTSQASLWFTPGGRGIWCVAEGTVELLGISQSGLQRIMVESSIGCLPSACPWRPSRGYEITSDGWLIGPEGKRLFMLPPPWRSSAARRVWSGQFLALLHGALPQAVILDLAPL